MAETNEKLFHLHAVSSGGDATEQNNSYILFTFYFTTFYFFDRQDNTSDTFHIIAHLL